MKHNAMAVSQKKNLLIALSCARLSIVPCKKVLNIAEIAKHFRVTYWLILKQKVHLWLN